jgi:hypothetical protein
MRLKLRLYLCGMAWCVAIVPMDGGAAAAGRFEGVWTASCSHLSGLTYIFHDQDRLRIVDLECTILGWKRDGRRLVSELACTLDGEPVKSRIAVVPDGDRLHITMGGRATTVRHCS